MSFNHKDFPISSYKKDVKTSWHGAANKKEKEKKDVHSTFVYQVSQETHRIG